MNEDLQVIRLVEGNFSRVSQEQAQKAERDARVFANRERVLLCILRLLFHCILGFIAMYAVNAAVECGLLGMQLGMLLILLPALYIGFHIGRFSKEVR